MCPKIGKRWWGPAPGLITSLANVPLLPFSFSLAPLKSVFLARCSSVYVAYLNRVGEAAMDAAEKDDGRSAEEEGTRALVFRIPCPLASCQQWRAVWTARLSLLQDLPTRTVRKISAGAKAVDRRVGVREEPDGRHRRKKKEEAKKRKIQKKSNHV